MFSLIFTVWFHFTSAMMSGDVQADNLVAAAPAGGDRRRRRGRNAAAVRARAQPGAGLRVMVHLRAGQHCDSSSRGGRTVGDPAVHSHAPELKIAPDPRTDPSR